MGRIASIFSRFKEKDGSSAWSTGNVKSLRTISYDDGKRPELSDTDLTYGYQKDYDTGDSTVRVAEDPDLEKSQSHLQVASSSAIESARYDPDRKKLYVTYKHGSGKEYSFKASPEDARSWLESSSKGRTTQEWRKSHYDNNWREG